uniref:Uncharacterized protein n=1 Tax=Arundo donax TaxID=35708 RepID=A0A0A9AQQ1_ARUDO
MDLGGWRTTNNEWNSVDGGWSSARSNRCARWRIDVGLCYCLCN